MNDLKEMTTSINKLTKTVDVGMTSLNLKFENLEKSHIEVSKEVRQMRSAQDSCPARTGLSMVNARLNNSEKEHKEARKENQETRIYVDSKFDSLRDDPTGQISEALLRAKAEQNQSLKRQSNGFIKDLVPRVLPYILLGLILFGAWLGSGGDAEKTKEVFDAIKEIGLKVEKIDNSKLTNPRTPIEESVYYPQETTQ